MNMNALSGANAYRNQLKMLEDAANAPSKDSAPSSSFAKLMETAAGDAVDTQYNTESMKLSALSGGKVDLSDLVTAVASAELSLNTVVAVRDRVINAYQDILRMPI
jgi:flagellar hook-basal body complex protein FliE